MTAETDALVHWGSVDSRPTSLHGNGAASFERTTTDTSKVTCSLCSDLLAKQWRLALCLGLPGCDESSHQIQCNEAYFNTGVLAPKCPRCGWQGGPVFEGTEGTRAMMRAVREHREVCTYPPGQVLS